MSERANINPRVLQWARTTARMSVEVAAAKLQVPGEKLADWEAGRSQPTLRQAEELARHYRRPFALFFLPDIPLDFQPLQDFRSREAVALGTASTFIIRDIQQKQAWMRELQEEYDAVPASFVGRFNLQHAPEQVAGDMLGELGISPGRYTARTPMREWIDRAEAKGIFISRTSFIHSRLKLDSEELQGFAIADPLAPFVFVNSEDWDSPQLFTLVHELAHLWIAATGISSDIEPTATRRDRLLPVELFCNEVAAAALMPASLLRSLPSESFQAYPAMYAKARQFGVSTFAFLYRSYTLELITPTQYRQYKKQADAAFRDYVQEQETKRLAQAKRDSGPSYYQLLLLRNGTLFTRMVIDAFRGGYMPPTQASSLLNTPVNRFARLESLLT